MGPSPDVRLKDAGGEAGGAPGWTSISEEARMGEGAWPRSSGEAQRLRPKIGGPLPSGMDPGVPWPPRGWPSGKGVL